MKNVMILVFFFFLFICPVRAQQLVESGGYAVPVYNFAQIKYLFHPSENNDTTYIFNFWATYCAPCIQEIPYFERIGKELNTQKLKIVLVSLDFRSRIQTSVIPFIKKRTIQLPVVVLNDPDANAWIGEVDPDWDGVIPSTLIVKGNNREFYAKEFTYDELRLLTSKFLEL